MRSLSRSAILKELSEKFKITIDNKKNKELFEFLFCQNLDEEKLDGFIGELYDRDRKERRKNEDYLYSQLYKLKVFDWGGFYQNAVEQAIVNNYIKKIQDYDKLCNIIDSDINLRIKGYILCSWYNHWSSILIEDIFKDHPDILPAVGLIKKVDFFWKQFPFDLKVTYFPVGFLQSKRKQRGLRPELTELKKYARKHDIYFDKEAKNKEIFSELLAKISEDTASTAKEFIKTFNTTREEIMLETVNDPKELIVWLYENQGIRRFDSANRFFLILVNLNNLEESWKLKRNQKLLKNKINNYLECNKTLDFNSLKVSFNWQETSYTTYSTALFILVK